MFELKLVSRVHENCSVVLE